MTPPQLRTAVRLLLSPLLAALLVLPAGCGQARSDGGPANLSITVEKGFVKRQSAYAVWPQGEESLFSFPGGTGGGGSTSGGDWNFGHGSDDPRGILVLIAVVVALAVVAGSVDLTYHNVHGLQLAVSVEGEGVYQSFPLHWGENRLQLTQFSLARLADGSASLFLSGSGTRHLRLRLPTAGLDWESETHAIALMASGELVADGRAVEMPAAPAGARDTSRR